MFPVSALTHTQTLRCLADDFEAMLERARLAGVKSMIITGGSLEESRSALKLAKKHSSCSIKEIEHSLKFDFVPTDLFATIGCHPTRSSEFDKYSGGPSAYLNALDKIIEQHIEGSGRVVAVGECGLGIKSQIANLSELILLSRL